MENSRDSAVVIGATGLVGSELVRQLIEVEAGTVTTLVRRKSGQHHERLNEKIIDFEQSAEWHALVQGDVLFCCLGTTVKTAGSQEAQWRVDFDYQYAVAKAARENGVKTIVLVSSTGANPRSPIFYSRMKGKLEEAIRELGFAETAILRPGILDGDRSEKRPAEKWTLGALKALPAAFLPASVRPVHVSIVARACRAAARAGGAGVTIFEAGDIFKNGA